MLCQSRSETLIIIRKYTLFKCEVMPSAGALIGHTVEINSSQTESS